MPDLNGSLLTMVGGTADARDSRSMHRRLRGDAGPRRVS